MQNQLLLTMNPMPVLTAYRLPEAWILQFPNNLYLNECFLISGIYVVQITLR